MESQLTFSDVKPTWIGLFQDIAPHIVQQFISFHKQNPGIYELFKMFARQIREAGYSRYGAGAIFERIRWHEMMELKNGDFKLNNNYRSCYTRLLILDEPSFKDFFETRSTVLVVT